jgi:hypothetical protein
VAVCQVLVLNQYNSAKLVAVAVALASVVVGVADTYRLIYTSWFHLDTVFPPRFHTHNLFVDHNTVLFVELEVVLVLE